MTVNFEDGDEVVKMLNENCDECNNTVTTWENVARCSVISSTGGRGNVPLGHTSRFGMNTVHGGAIFAIGPSAPGNVDVLCFKTCLTIWVIVDVDADHDERSMFANVYHLNVYWAMYATQEDWFLDLGRAVFVFPELFFESCPSLHIVGAKAQRGLPRGWQCVAGCRRPCFRRGHFRECLA